MAKEKSLTAESIPQSEMSSNQAQSEPQDLFVKGQIFFE
jgi:hypothetical protein